MVDSIHVVALDGTVVYVTEMWYEAGSFPTVDQVREALRLGDEAKVRILAA